MSLELKVDCAPVNSGVRRNESSSLVSDKSMRLTLTTLHLCLVALLGVAVCVAQQGNSPTADESKERGEVVGFRCPDREMNQPRPETKLDLGDVTKKAVELPRPDSSRWSRGSRITGIAQAEVVIDINSGKVVWARLLNGHPLLRLSVGDVVCRARFSPTYDVDGRARGVITYRAVRRR
jgi:hypothetical protein